MSVLLASGYAAPAYNQAAVAVGSVPVTVGHAVSSQVVPAGPPLAQVQESYHPGPAVAKTYVQHGVVGHRTVQVGTQPVQVGHEYYVAGQEVHQPQPYSVVASEAVNTQQTVPIAPPALPVASPAAAVIPPAPIPYGPAPADTVTQERVLAPVRTHTRITPRVTRIEPELQVNRVPYEVLVKEPVPVHREVIVQKPVQKPYTVEVPRAVPVPAPYQVHPVHEVVETPIVREHSVSIHQPTVHAVTAVHPVAAPVAAVGYAAAPVEQKY